MPSGCLYGTMSLKVNYHFLYKFVAHPHLLIIAVWKKSQCGYFSQKIRISVSRVRYITVTTFLILNGFCQITCRVTNDTTSTKYSCSLDHGIWRLHNYQRKFELSMIVRHDIIILELHEVNMHPIRIPGFKIQWQLYDNIDFTILQICNIRFHAPIPDPGWPVSVFDHSPRTSGGDHRLSWIIVAVCAGKLS